MADEMGVFETMYNCRAMRRLKPDPVSEELLVKLIDAANQAPTGSNAQGARWIVVRDPEQRAKLAALNKTAVEAYVAPGGRRAAALPHQSADKRQRMLAAVLWQAEHMQDIPALVIACYQFGQPVRQGQAMGGGSIWPAVQNLLLAARALGLGAAPTTLGLANRTAAPGGLGSPGRHGGVLPDPRGLSHGQFRSGYPDACSANHALGSVGVANCAGTVRLVRP